MTKKAVLFDLDGTLLHTVPDLAAAVNAMLADLGKPVLPEETVAVYVGKGAENLVNRSLTGSMTEKASPNCMPKPWPTGKVITPTSMAITRCFIRA